MMRVLLLNHFVLLAKVVQKLLKVEKNAGGCHMCYAIFSHFILTAHALQVTPLHFLPNNQGAPDEEEPSPQPPEFPQTPPLTEVPQPNDPPTIQRPILSILLSSIIGFVCWPSFPLLQGELCHANQYFINYFSIIISWGDPYVATQP